MLHREHGAMFARFGTISDLTAGTLERRRENLADALPPLQLQPRIFSHQISSIGAVARSPQELTPSEGPALRLQRTAIARRSPPAVAHHRDLDATVSGVTTTAPARGDVRFRGKTGSRGLSVKPTRLTRSGHGGRATVWPCSLRRSGDVLDFRSVRIALAVQACFRPRWPSSKIAVA
jgi:hypothetical protein